MIHLWRGKDAGAASREPLKVQPAWRPAARGLSSAPGRNAMAKAEIKTKATDVSVADFIAAVPDARRREEAAIVDAIHRRITGLAPKMWGPSIIGYGSYDYVYDSGHSGTMCRAGFSPRKAAMTLYLMGHYCRSEEHPSELQSLMRISYAVFCLKKK